MKSEFKDITIETIETETWGSGEAERKSEQSIRQHKFKHSNIYLPEEEKRGGRQKKIFEETMATFFF